MLIHVVDFEGSSRCGVIEFGVVTLDRDQIIDTRTSLCRANAPILPKESLLHGIRNESLENRESFDTCEGLFFAMRKNGVFAAHHAPVEDGFLSRYWTVAPSTHVELPSNLRRPGSWGPWIDTCKLAKEVWKGLESYSLTELVKYFDFEPRLKEFSSKYCPEDRRFAHCALYDALASAMLINLIRSETEWEDRQLIEASSSGNRSSSAQSQEEWDL